MPELPEIFNIARQMNKELFSKKIILVDVRQEKCLNMPANDFKSLLNNKIIGPITSRGKWVFVKLEPDAYFLLSLGMGGNVLYHKSGEELPDKYHLKLEFHDDSILTIGFWWFGYCHAVSAYTLETHKMTSKLGLSPIDEKEFNYDSFDSVLQGRRGNIKSFLMNQKYIAGIGNVYIQDILFKAKLHPNRKIPDIAENERRKLFEAIRTNLKEAVELGGLAYEKDLYNRPGRVEDFLVGYREASPCPECGTEIRKIRTGSTATYICPSCQK